jgi:hypothetical protein
MVAVVPKGLEIARFYARGHKLKPVLLKSTSRATEEQALASEQRTLSEQVQCRLQ